jgi:hypothetical protein
MPIRCSGRPILSSVTEERAKAACKEMIVRYRFFEFFLLLASAVALISLSIPARAAYVLITEEEAKLPPPRGAVVADRRGITRGPKIDVVMQGEQIHSPMHFQLKFESFGGAKIDPESVKVIYLRTPNVDLTPRIKSFVQSTGIDIPDVELPVGDHMVRVDIKDSDGRVGSTSFLLKVTP